MVLASGGSHQTQTGPLLEGTCFFRRRR